ncbi:MAG: SLATT domain-containing protein [Halioglobus sp.]
MERLADFFQKTEGLNWSKEDVRKSLAALFKEVDKLAMAEVQYYYRQRTTRRRYSRLGRLVAWALGSGGILAPLISAAEPERFQYIAPYGYVLIAAAASVLAINSLMGGTDGHIRFTATQIRLEQIITSYRIKWFNFLAQIFDDENGQNRGFEIISNYATALHEETVSETGVWGQTLTAELDKFSKKMDSKSG